MPFLIDTHSHLHFPPYDQDREGVISRMREKSVWTITVGTSKKNSEHAIQCAEAWGGVWAAVGLHPEHVSSDFHDPNEGHAPEAWIDEPTLEALATSSKKVVAIGETGLDFHRIDEGRDKEEERKKQIAQFLIHVHVARKNKLPLILHCREATDDLLAVLRKDEEENGPVQGVMHSFSGTWEQAQACLDLGLYIGVNGIVTFPPKKSLPKEYDLKNTIEQVPLDRLIIETDAPYLAPVPFRGKRNEPVYVEEVAKQIAQIRGLSLEEVARTTTENAIKLFQLPATEA